MMIFMKEYLNKVDFEKNQHTTKKWGKFPMGQRVKKSYLCDIVSRTFRGGKFLKYLLVLHAHEFVNSIVYIGNCQFFYLSCSIRYSSWRADKWIFLALHIPISSFQNLVLDIYLLRRDF